MITLKKWLQGPWERVRQHLIDDLESIETGFNSKWSAVFTNTNKLKGKVELSNLPAATQPGVLLGRESGSTGDFEEIVPGAGLAIKETTLELVPGEFVGHLPFSSAADGDDGLVGPPGIQGITGLQGLAGPPGRDGEDSDGVGSVPVSNGLVISGFTRGSVIFAGLSGALTEDNTNFFWDDTNNYLGLGTPTPSFPLDITVTQVAFGAGSVVRLTNKSTAAGAASALDILTGDTSGSFVLGRLLSNSPNAADPTVTFGTATSHELVIVTSSGEKVRFNVGGDTLMSFGGKTISYPALRRAAAVLETRLGDDSAYADFKVSNLITNAMVKVGGTSSAFPGLKNNSAELQVRLADDSAFTTLSSARLQITATSADNKAIYLTGTINSQTPAMFYNDTAMTGIGNTGAESAQGFYVAPSFSLGGNAASVGVMVLPATTVTLNGHTLTNATTLDIENCPTNGTNKRAMWVRAGLSEFDGLLALGGNTSSFTALKANGTTAQLRLADDSAYATLDVLGLKASGVAGVSFGPAAVTSITIVNGIVTACS